MQISEMLVKSVLSGDEYIPILDSDEQNVEKRNKRILLSAIAGLDGDQGPPGASAYEVWLSQGNSGNPQAFLDSLVGPAGDDGAVGKSIYDIWLEQGNFGTEADFLLTLKGPQGDHGTTWYFGSSVPSNSVGVDGDFFVNTGTGRLYIKQSGDWGSGYFTMSGSPGSRWYTGTTTPNNATGVNGDFYLRTTTGDVYGPKVAGSWGAVSMNLVGPQGDQGIQGIRGSQILQGVVNPDDGQGIENDFYLNTATGAFYGPKTTVWGAQTMQLVLPTSEFLLKDETGTTQITTTFADGISIGADGDVSLDWTGGILTISSETTWTSLQDKPTTRNGYGLTDVYTIDETDDAISTALGSLPKFFHYVGEWDPSTNTPPLSNTDTGVQGNVWRATETATVDFGAGPIQFNDGDFAINNGTIWTKWDVTDTVVSVNGYEGIVELDSDDIDEGTSNLYFTPTRAIAALGTINGLLLGDGAGGVTAAVAGTDYASPTNGTNGQALTSDGAGGFGAPITLGTAATASTAEFDAAGQAAYHGGLAQAYADGLIVQTITEDDETHTPSADAVFIALGLKIDTSEIGVSVAPLVAGLIPSIYLPSFVDDVIDIADYASLPVTGEAGKIYVVLDGGILPDNKQYRWSGSTYVEIIASPGTTDNVPEGTLNKYFTDTLAQQAVVVQTITDGDEDHAPSGAAVYDALELKANASDLANLAAKTQTDEMMSGMIGTPTDKNYRIVLKAAHGGAITETTTVSESGTCTLTFKINSTALGGTPNSVSNVEQSQAHASDNVFVAGDDIVVTVSGNAACIDLSFTIKYTRVYG